jgi:uncharacterized protein YktB (UPF0637 family)
MSSKFTETLVNTLAPVIEIMAAEQLAGVFNRLHDKDPKAYAKYIPDLYEMTKKHLQELTSQSKSKIDDVIVQALENAIEQSAEVNGLELK